MYETLEHYPGTRCLIDTAKPEWAAFVKLVQSFSRRDFGLDLMQTHHKDARGTVYELYCNHFEFTPYDLAVAMGYISDGETTKS